MKNIVALVFVLTLLNLEKAFSQSGKSGEFFARRPVAKESTQAPATPQPDQTKWIECVSKKSLLGDETKQIFNLDFANKTAQRHDQRNTAYKIIDEAENFTLVEEVKLPSGKLCEVKINVSKKFQSYQESSTCPYSKMLVVEGACRASAMPRPLF